MDVATAFVDRCIADVSEDKLSTEVMRIAFCANRTLSGNLLLTSLCDLLLRAHTVCIALRVQAASMAKAHATEVANRVANQCLQLYGG